MDPPKVHSKKEDLGKVCADEDEFWPLSGAPYFSVILTKSQVKTHYNMSLPAKSQKILSDIPEPVLVVLACRGKKWNMNYLNKRFNPKWREFAVDNNLNAGDDCVLEMTNHSSTLVEFRVQILRSYFPSELMVKEEGDSADDPIMID